jgi:hypothetical protein
MENAFLALIAAALLVLVASAARSWTAPGRSRCGRRRRPSRKMSVISRGRPVRIFRA